MIAVRLKGGLGNQMFQYAIGRSLSLHHHTELFLDTSMLESNNQPHVYRKYSLDTLNVSVKILQKDSGLIPRDRKSSLSRFLNIFNMKELNLVAEKNFRFDQHVLKAPDNSYLDGYWQSYNYFESNADVLKREFSLKGKLSGKANNISDKIISSNAVVIHIRRGDYVSSPETASYHGNCDISYYEKAIQLMQERNRDLAFFVFSDDPSWVRQNFKATRSYDLVSGEGLSNVEELHLMALCKHAIVANSSFSWWGAWLMNNPDKTIIAPKQWFKDTSIITDDMFPKTWLRI